MKDNQSDRFKNKTVNNIKIGNTLYGNSTQSTDQLSCRTAHFELIASHKNKQALSL